MLERFRVEEGITEKQIDQLLINTTSDPLISKYTSDRRRFGNIEAFEDWRKKGRSIYTLPSKEGDLAGIIWFGEEQISNGEYIVDFNPEEYGITFAIRIYKQARSKGLANPFMLEAFARFRSSEEYRGIGNKGVWLEVTQNNIPAIKAYKKFGFQRVTNPDEEGKIIMILHRQNDRLRICPAYHLIFYLQFWRII